MPDTEAEPITYEFAAEEIAKQENAVELAM